MVTESVDFCLLGADYVLLEDGSPVIRLFGKAGDGRSVVLFDRSFRPYFYAEPKDDAEALRRLLFSGVNGVVPENVEIMEKNLYGKPLKVLKITLKDPTKVPVFKEAIEKFEGVKRTFEYNIAFYKRYLIDKGLSPLGWSLVECNAVEANMNFDLAISDFSMRPLDRVGYPPLKTIGIYLAIARKGFSEEIERAEIAGDGIKIIIDRDGDSNTPDTVGSEEALINRFIEAVKEIDPDVICGFNSDSIAFRRLEAAAGKYGIRLNLGRGGENLIFVYKGTTPSASITGRVHIDFYNFIENSFYHRVSADELSLDTAAEGILGREIKGNKAGAIMEISKELLPWIFEISRVSGQTPFDSSRMGISNLLEWIFISKSFHVGELVPNRPTSEEMALRRQKAHTQAEYVYEPEAGIYGNVGMFRLSGIYPQIVTANNISPETFNCSCCQPSEDNSAMKAPGEGYRFCSIIRGFVPQVMDEILGGIGKPGGVKDDVSRMVAEGVYDYFGQPASRWYSLICHKSLKAWGREKVVEAAKNVMVRHRLLYADAEVLFVKTADKMEAADAVKMVNGLVPQAVFNGVYQSSIFFSPAGGIQSRSRYALLDEKGRVSAKGFDTVKRDWCRLAKLTQNKVIEILLVERDFLKAVEFVRDTVIDIKNGNVQIKDLSISTRINKQLADYEQVGPHVAAAQKAALAGRTVREGDIITYVISKGAGSISDRATFLSVAKDYDPDYYIYNQVLPAALRVLADFGFSENDLDPSGERQTQLSRFISPSISGKLKEKLTTLERYKT